MGMFAEVIVGVDNHRAGRDAIALAERLATPETKLTLAHVLTSDPYLYRGVSAELAAAERKDAEELLERARAGTAMQTRLRWIRSSSVGRGLHELVSEQDADLLVVGSSSRGPVGRVLQHDDTRGALNEARCAVAIAPGDYAATPGLINHVGIAYNGSPESEAALVAGRVLAASHGAQLSACAVVPGESDAPHHRLPRPGDAPAELIEARDRLGTMKGVRPYAACGEPAQKLAIYSGSLDLLIIGSRSYGALGRLVHGSTSSQLTRTAQCPLLVLPRAAAATTIDRAEKTPTRSAHRHAG